MRRIDVRLRRALGEAIGARIKELRSDAGLTQEQLAQRARTFGPIVARLESGRTIPDWWTLAELARGLELDLRTLLTGIDWAPIDAAARATIARSA